MALRNPPMDTPHEIHLYLTTKLPDAFGVDVEIALAFLFDIPNCDDFANLLKKLKEQNDLNVTLLKEFLDICREYSLVATIDEYFKDHPDYKDDDEAKYSAVKRKLNKSGPTFTQQFLSVRIRIVELLMFPDKMYMEDDKVVMLDYFDIPKRIRERNPTLLSAFIMMEQKYFDPKDKWFACDMLVILLLDIMLRKESNELDLLIKDCMREESGYKGSRK